MMFSVFALVLGVDVASADSVVVPGLAEGNVNNVAPFGLGSAYFAPQITGRYQQIYGAGSFPVSSMITGLAFRLDQNGALTAGGSTLSDVLVKLSTTSKAVDGLDTVFANNFTGLDTTVYAGALAFSWSASSGAQRPFDLHIALQQAFLYDPSLGNLLLDITIIGGNTLGSSTPTFDAAQAIDAVSRVGSTSSSPTGWQAISGTTDTIGLVTQFTTTPVPEPASGQLLVGGLLVAGYYIRRRTRSLIEGSISGGGSAATR